MDSPASPLEGPLVGRDRELATLIARLDRASAGQGGVVLLAGEPGIGKTRLAEELAAVAEGRGVHALWGRCYEGEGAPAFWPWVEILRSAIRGESAARLRAEMGAGLADIATLVPDARSVVAPGAERGSGSGVLADGGRPPDAAAARFRLFDAVTTYLGLRAARQPHLLVLDDLQCADASSLSLLQFLARGADRTRVLVLGTYRDVEVGRDHPLSAALTALNRERGYQHLSLGGLSPAATAALLGEAGRVEVQTGSFVQALHRLTGGNPLFIRETVRHLAETGRLAWPAEPGSDRAPALEALEVPESVRGVIRQRLTRLSAPAERILSMAAVVGREFDVATLAAVPETAGLPALEALDAAEAARLVAAEVRAAGTLRYRFTHDVIRETLYADLGRAERARLHH